VAEDNKINQRIMLSLLTRLGYKADLVPDGAAAVEAAVRQTYDLILMDVQMPNLDGWQATRAIREHFSGRLQPQIIAVTAHGTSDDHTRCTEAGMNGYLTKPLSKEVLSRALTEVEKITLQNAASTIS
jgi:CheY-like chemotaxis protein